jgi:DNA gyrase subunit A
VVREELLEVRGRYADARRTQILHSESTKVVNAEDLLPDEEVWIMLGEKGTIARTTSPEPVNVPQKPAEQPVALQQANTQDILYLFSADGQAVSLPVYQLPQARELGQGTHWADLTPFSRRNHLAAMLVRPKTATEGYVFFTTVGGIVKRVRLDDLPAISSEQFTVMNVTDEDALGWAMLTTGENEIMLATAAGQVIRFPESEVRAMGLPAGGVLGIKLADEADGLVAMDVYRPGSLIWSITDNGLAKATAIDEYPLQGRHGQGVINLRLPEGAAEVVRVLVGDENTHIIITTAIGTTKKIRLKQTYTGSRSIKPRSIISISARNRVIGAVRFVARPDVVEDEETAVAAEQLPLIADAPPKKARKTRTKK